MCLIYPFSSIADEIYMNDGRIIRTEDAGKKVDKLSMKNTVGLST